MDPLYFPFEIINSDNLIPGDNYYIKLNDRVISNFLTNRRKLPVSHLKGTFVRLHNENNDDIIVEYAVFKNVKILNHLYKSGLCNQMMVRYPEGILASTSCDSYSDNNRTINYDREVYFNLKKWIFGIPTETKLITEKALTSITPYLNADVVGVTEQIRGINKGGKKKRKTRRRRKYRNNRKHKTNKRI